MSSTAHPRWTQPPTAWACSHKLTRWAPQTGQWVKAKAHTSSTCDFPTGPFAFSSQGVTRDYLINNVRSASGPLSKQPKTWLTLASKDFLGSQVPKSLPQNKPEVFAKNHWCRVSKPYIRNNHHLLQSDKHSWLSDAHQEAEQLISNLRIASSSGKQRRGWPWHLHQICNFPQILSNELPSIHPYKTSLEKRRHFFSSCCLDWHQGQPAQFWTSAASGPWLWRALGVPAATEPEQTPESSSPHHHQNL